MDYNKFLDYAFPIFGIAIVVLVASITLAGGIAKWVEKINNRRINIISAWVVLGLVCIGFLATGTMLLIGWFLPWGSPF